MRERVKSALQNTSQLRAVFRLYEGTRSWNFRLMRHNWRYRSGVAEDGLPIPPVRLIVKVTGGADIAAFLSSTYYAADSIHQILARNGLAVDQFQSLLDFGCGCGRVIRRWLGRAFEVVNCVPQGATGNPHQDAYLLRKPATRPA